MMLWYHDRDRIRLRAFSKLLSLAVSRLCLYCFPFVIGFQGYVNSLAQTPNSDYERLVNEALRSDRDVWGEKLLVEPEGPTAENVAGLLHPLIYCGTSVAAPEIYYLTFGIPEDLDGGGDAALHLADGSKIVSREILSESAMELFVGPQGQEPFGSSLERLETIELREGYQPVLITHYRDSGGNRYRQESFADHLPGTSVLASFVRMDVTSNGVAEVAVRLTSAGSRLSRSGSSLVQEGRTQLFFSGNPTFDGTLLRYRTVPNGEKPHTLFLVRPNHPVSSEFEVSCSESSYLASRERITRYWNERLAKGLIFQVPEEVVMDAQRNILIQNLFLGWRYSYGNAYETFYQPEGGDTAHLLGLFGFLDEERACLQALLARSKGREFYFNWELGEKLSHAAQYYSLTGDAGFIHQNKMALDRSIRELGGQIDGSPDGLLRKERFSGDIEAKDFYLHQQAVCWRGLRDMAAVLRELGYKADAESCSGYAAHLKSALLKAVEQSKVDLEDGTVFVPTRLLASVEPYIPVTGTRLGTYWNLVIPYALSSGLLPADLSGGLLRFMINHGSLFLGLLRCNYYPVEIGSFRENGLPGYATSGWDNVYAVNLIEALAEHNEPDRIVLALYSKICHGMTRNTYVSGEGATLGVIPGQEFRSMYLPPNSANNSLLLRIVRTQMVYEKVDDRGLPSDLLLTHFSPRSWLDDGKEISFRDAPSLFGPISLSIRSRLKHDQIDVSFQTPRRKLPNRTWLCLRTPRRREIVQVLHRGESFDRFDSSNEKIDLSGLTGKVELTVHYRTE